MQLQCVQLALQTVRLLECMQLALQNVRLLKCVAVAGRLRLQMLLLLCCTHREQGTHKFQATGVHRFCKDAQGASYNNAPWPGRGFSEAGLWLLAYHDGTCTFLWAGWAST
eukprot:364041-Chlamydomonas_euryale.AAC.6